MSYTLQQLQQMGATPTPKKSYTLDELQKLGATPTQQVTAPAEPPKSFLQKTGPSFPAVEGGASTIVPNIARTIGNIPSSVRDLTRGVVGVVPAIASNIGESAKAVQDIVHNVGPLEGAKTIYNTYADTVNKVVGGALSSVGNRVSSGYVSPGSNNDGKGPQILSNLVKKGIEDPALIPSLLYTPGEVGGESLISKLAKPVTRGADTSIVGNLSRLTARSEEQINSKIIQNFEKGVKPTLPSRATQAQTTKYRDDILNATKVINENKDTLSFTDDVGDVITGQNPRSLQQLSDALEQTKGTIFKKYDALAKSAGDAGLKVHTGGIAGELDAVIGNKALQLTNPNAVKYAEALKQRLSTIGDITPETAQEAIKNYNKSLEAFYRNPTYDSASQAAIDALVANRLRQALDEGVTGLTGAQYQELKNQYASLKTIERDVIKASLRDARKNTRGLIDFTDIFTGGDIVGGILSLNPAQVGRGLVGRGVKEFYKYLNDPNRAIERLFNAVESQAKPSILNTALPNAGTRLQSAPMPSTTATPNTNEIIPKTLPQAVEKSSRVKLPKKVDPLLTEARKYKSAEEFVKAQGEPVYHGTGYGAVRKIQKEGLNPQKAISGVRDGSKNIFFTADEKYAGSYASLKGGGNGFILGFKSPEDAVIEVGTYKKGMKFPDLISKTHIPPEDIVIKGRDGKWYPIKEFNLWTGEPDTFLGKNPVDFKTKSQLTDIWKKANGKK